MRCNDKSSCLGGHGDDSAAATDAAASPARPRRGLR